MIMVKYGEQTRMFPSIDLIFAYHAKQTSQRENYCSEADVTGAQTSIIHFRTGTAQNPVKARLPSASFAQRQWVTKQLLKGACL
jgi:hypothetical protein